MVAPSCMQLPAAVDAGSGQPYEPYELISFSLLDHVCTIAAPGCVKRQCWGTCHRSSHGYLKGLDTSGEFRVFQRTRPPALAAEARPFQVQKGVHQKPCVVHSLYTNGCRECMKRLAEGKFVCRPNAGHTSPFDSLVDLLQVQPAILTGTFGYAIGTPLGFFVASKVLKPLAQHVVPGL